MWKKIIATKLFLSLVLVFGFYSIAYRPLTNPINTHGYDMPSNHALSNPLSFKLANKGNLRVATYNVHGLPHTDNPTCDNLIRIGQELGKLRKTGSAPDIIAIQEGFHEKTEQLIKLSGYPYVARGPGVSYEKTKISSGLWVLSEYPVKTVKTTSYNTCATWDCWSNKGIQKVLVTVTNENGEARREIELYNTHMNAYTEYDPWTEREEISNVKLKQINQFKQFYKSTHVSSMSSLVVGDFNFVEASALYKKFMLPGFTNSINYIVGKMPKRLLDHQYVVQGPSIRLIPNKYEKFFNNRNLSDHSGIAILYELSYNKQ